MREILLFLLLPHLIISAPSQRGKCALECYSKCLSTGTASAVYCNCPIQRSFAQCNAIEERLNTAPVGTLAGASTEYLDAHSIRVKIGSVEGAFIYVFEYATISTSPDQWLFAGASSSPSISFTVMDPCRDYQFRVLAIVRPSTTGQNDVIIYHALPIPVQLPAFVLHPDQISVEPPLWNTTEEQVKVYVRWSLPRFYSDSDVYGYESPAIYPIECEAAPEEELPTPKIEIVRNGGRLAVWLPARILEARCRLWVEVHMLPRCVRLEPFSVQKAIELDCSRTPELEACLHATGDLLPECTDVIDVWGKNGQATVMWQAPSRTPLSYSVRFGRATVQDAAPLISWKMNRPKIMSIDGNRTSVALKLDPGVDYGIQVCAIFSERRLPKYDVLKVTPLICKQCKKEGDKKRKCNDCSKIEFPAEEDEEEEEEMVEDTSPFTNIFTTTEDIFSDSFDPKKNVSQAKQANIHKVEVPLLFTGKEGSGLAALKDGKELSNETDEVSPTSSGEIDTSTFDQILTTLNAEGKDLFRDTPVFKPITVEGESLASNRIAQDWPAAGLVTKVESKEASTTVPSTTVATTTTPTKTTVTTSTMKSTTTKALVTTSEAPEKKSRLDQVVHIRMDKKPKVAPKTPECFLSNGIKCDHGCILPTIDSAKHEKERCICPSPLSVMIDGSCYEIKASCLKSSKINATWDPSTMNVMVPDTSIDQGANRLFVDVGAVTTKQGNKFIEPKKIRQRIELTIEPNRPSGLTHMIRLNQSIDNHLDYGIRLCQFRVGSINAMRHNWEELGDDTIAIITKLASASTSAPVNDKELPPRYDNYWSVFFTIGKVAILVALVLIMAVLVYLNCSRLRTFYDRKRTHYFRPFVIDGRTESRSLASRYPMGLPRTNPDLIGYPQRNRVM